MSDRTETRPARVRILVVCGDPGVPIHGPSGASAHLRDVAEALAALGHRVSVAAICPHDHRGRYGIHFDLPSVTVGLLRGPEGLRGAVATWQCRRLLRRALRSFGPVDLVYERASLHGDAGVRLARHLGAAHWLEVNAPLDVEARRAGRLGWTVRHTDQVLAVSPWMVDWARGLGAKRVVHLPNASALRDPGLPKLEGCVAVHHGSLQAWHGTSFLPRLLDAMPTLRIRVVGPAPLPAHARLEQLPWLEHDALAAALSPCHVGLLPYPDDAPPWLDPLKAADYRAVGLPVLGSLHTAARSADLQVDVGDLQGWVEGIERLASSPAALPGPSWSEALAPLFV